MSADGIREIVGDSELWDIINDLEDDIQTMKKQAKHQFNAIWMEDAWFTSSPGQTYIEEELEK